MAIAPPSFRFPFATLAKLPPEAQAAHQATFDALTDIYQAIALQKQNSSSSTTTVNETVQGTSGTSTSSSGVSSFNGATGSVTFFPYLGFVNDQTGQTTYTTQTEDNGGLVILKDASPVSVILNFAVSTPWFTNLINEGTANVTVTSTQGTINGGSSLTLLPTYSATVYFDGVNWLVSTLPIVPVNTPAVLHQWLKSYNSATGAFTQTQPAFTDISGTATTTQIGTGTPSAGEYVDGGTGAWTALPGGLSVTITTAALTSLGTQGSMTFVNGRLTAQVQAT